MAQRFECSHKAVFQRYLYFLQKTATVCIRPERRLHANYPAANLESGQRLCDRNVRNIHEMFWTRFFFFYQTKLTKLLVSVN